MIVGLRLVCLIAAAVGLLAGWAWAPAVVALSLALSSTILARARAAAEGTALLPGVYWAVCATVLGLLSQVVALIEPIGLGRPISGQFTYVMTLAGLAALISVLNARTPGAGAWAILNMLLVLVFLIPWLEGAGLAATGRGLARLRLDSPWTIFFGLLVVAGVTNYLPTKFGPAAALLALGFWLEFDALTHPLRSRTDRATAWSYFPLAWAAALAVAERCARGESDSLSRFGRIWLFFRDHWGVVWALRTQERFNRSASSLGWSIHLTWHGVSGSSNLETDEAVAAEAMLLGLLRRFVTAERIGRMLESRVEGPCQGKGLRR